MTLTVLTCPSELESAQKLGYPTYTDVGQPSPSTTVLRWGNSELLGGHDFPARVNPAEAIKLNCHKRKALVRMAEAGIHTPDRWRYGEIVGATTSGWALLRPLAHSRGENFSLIRPGRAVPADHYATEWIQTDREYRVWFAWDRTLIAQRVPMTGQHGGEFPCRSEWGYRFVESDFPRLRRETLRAAAAIGLTTGCADVLVKRETVEGRRRNRYVFVELNSAPTIDHRKLRRFYQQELARRFGPPA